MRAIFSSELMLAEPSVETEPYDLSGDEHELLRRAVMHYAEHLRQVGRECRQLNGTNPPNLGLAVGRLGSIYDRIVLAQAITITPDEE